MKQTAGYIATKMVSFYMERSGFHYGISHKTKAGFAEYWGARRNRSSCAAWFAVQLARASQGVGPTRKDYIHRICRLRKRIDKFPPDERTWVLLRLNGEMGSDTLVTESGAGTKAVIDRPVYFNVISLYLEGVILKYLENVEEK